MVLATAVIERPIFQPSTDGLREPERGFALLSAGDGGELRHQPVLLREVVELLGARSGGSYVDGTLGEGGHAQAILEASGPDGTLLGIDRDPRSLAAARRRLEGYGGRATLVHGNYADMKEIASGCGITAADGILLDLGFSSRQIDGAGYGLSFQRDEPLDMRYDSSGDTAADIVNSTSERDLADLIFQYGEERRSRAIARAIVNNRPVATTGRLAELVARAVGGRRGARHPATRTFQALRIAVNQELSHLEAGLASALDLLRSGGRLAVISYHSLEDRLTKEWVDRETATCICPPDLPICVCEHEPTLRLVGRRPTRPSRQETAGNPRSRSARLRVVERI